MPTNFTADQWQRFVDYELPIHTLEEREWMLRRRENNRRENNAMRVPNMDAAVFAQPELGTTPKPPVTWCPEYYTTPISDLAQYVTAGSVDWVITDPPYPREFLYVWSELAEFAVHALRPGGCLVAMAAEVHLPEVMRGLTHDDLVWRYSVFAHLPGAARAVMGNARISRVYGKPNLVYTRRGAQPEKMIRTNYVSIPSIKRQASEHHHWGQNPATYVRLMELLPVSPGDVVCDPFLGGGTTAMAARRMGVSRFIGADADGTCVSTTQERMAALEQELKGAE